MRRRRVGCRRRSWPSWTRGRPSARRGLAGARRPTRARRGYAGRVNGHGDATLGAAGVIRVLLADDQALVRAGFRVLVDSDSELQVVAEATNGAEAFDLAL